MQTMIDYMEALENWANARQEYRSAVAKGIAGGLVSLDYYLYRERCRYDDAAKVLQAAFTNAVLEVVDYREERRHD